MPSRIELPPIPPEEETPLVKMLVAIIERLMEENQRQAETIQQMRDEIAVLKGEKGKPKFKSSKMDQKAGKKDDDIDGEDKKKRPGSAKRSKTGELVIHEEKVIAPQEAIPPDARFKGYRDFVVQDLVIKTHNTLYRLECWQTEEGDILVGQLPKALQGQHYGSQLRTYILC
jgi:hypothetical protein